MQEGSKEAVKEVVAAPAAALAEVDDDIVIDAADEIEAE